MLLLIALLQVSPILALPYRLFQARRGTELDTTWTLRRLSPRDDAEPSGTNSFAPSPSQVASAVFVDPTAYELPDGEVRVEASVSVVAYSAIGTLSPVPTPTQGTTTSTTIIYSSMFVTETSTISESSSAVPTYSVQAYPLTSLTTSAVQTVSAPPSINTQGAVHTTLETSGNPSAQPFPTTSVASNVSLSLVDTSTLSNVRPTATVKVTSLSVNDIFQPIGSDAPPSQVSSRGDHPVPTEGIQTQQQRLETNKFYANFFLGDQSSATWTHPYSVAWGAGSGETDSWGLSVSHIERDQETTGAKTSSDAGEIAYFVNPLGLESLVLSACELTNGTTLTTDTLTGFSVNVNLLAPGGSTPLITFPLIQGMGFVTGVYDDGTPLLQTGLGITNLTYVGSVVDGTTYKYRALLADGVTWLIYVTPSSPSYSENSFTLLSQGTAVQGSSGFTGQIQVAKIPLNNSAAETIYDGAAGTYATAVNLTGSVEGTTGTYSLSWTTQGPTGQKLLVFALPHHIASFANETSGAVTDVQLVTTTKGMATGVLGDTWTMVEPDLPVSMSFNPWSPSLGDVDTLPQEAIEAINIAGATELQQNMSLQTNVGSMYYDGKALAKFAAIVYVLHDLADNITLALTGLEELEQNFALFVDNGQIYPLVYDTVWGGAVSISSYLNNNSGDDFGNTYYNDHHFHYGYFLYAAAIIGYLDPSWLEQGSNKAWVNMLARDFANSVPDDPYFPFSRMFDWYHGHSWAEGLFESADGKNEESSSEDTMASLGVKMWGRIIGDEAMEARGNLMLAVQARSLQNYFLYESNNTVEPSDFIGNKVSGILFENKIDHTTYFGNNIEYIEGIHMLPLLPMSTLTRTQVFVQQEWTAYDFDSYVPTLDSGWRGILMANLAIIDPPTSYSFFSNATGDFTFDLLDGGASQTWYLAWSAGLGGVTSSSNGRREIASGHETRSKRGATQKRKPRIKVSEVSGGDVRVYVNRLLEEGKTWRSKMQRWIGRMTRRSGRE